jgi:hypothetical protein
MRMTQALALGLRWMGFGMALGLWLARSVLAGIELSVAQAELHKAALEDGGHASTKRSTLALEQAWNVPQGGGLGLRLSLERETWDFDGGHRFAAAPWRRVEQGAVSLPMRAPLDAGHVLLLLPRLACAREEGARASHACTTGVMAAVLKGFDPHRRLGVGLEAVRTLEGAWELAPVLIVDWRWNEHWRLFNPPELGPAGSAGLELARRLGPRVELGLGVAEHERGFRLATDHPNAPGGTGLARQVQAFLHLSWKPSPDVALHAYAGALLDGELALRDRAGHRLAQDRLESAPVLGIVGRVRF